MGIVVRSSKPRPRRQIVLTVVHLAVFCYVLYQYDQSSDKQSPFTTRGLHDIRISDGGVTTTKAASTTTDMFVVVLVLFPMITALFHFIRYMSGDSNKRVRFVEYSITSTMMLYLVATSSGVLSLDVMYSILAVNVTIMLLGIVIERQLENGDRKSAMMLTVLAWGLLGVTWVPIIRSFQANIEAQTSDSTGVPGTNGQPSKVQLNAILYATMTFFSCFGLVQLGQMFEWWSPQKSDVAYDVLSVLSKAVLAYFVASGFFARME